MSKKKMFNLIELIASVLLLLSMVVLPYVEIEKNTAYSGISSKLPFGYGTYTFFDYVQMGERAALIRVPFALLIVINAIICAVSAFGKSNKRDTAAHTVLPTIFSVIGLFFCLIGPSDGTSYNTTPYALFSIVFLVLLVLITVFSFLKRSLFAFPKGGSPTPISKNDSLIDVADELKKYKELLDSGVITQEEFDAKKKQLMGL